MWELFEPQLNLTMSHKFRNGEDVITPLLHHAVASAEHGSSLSNAAATENLEAQAAPTTVGQVEVLVGNGVLEATGSKAGFYLCHLRDRPVACELAKGQGAELYENIISGKLRGRSFAFNDDGYKNMNVAKEFRDFAERFLPEPSKYEIYPLIR
jgi:hypothetical protein